ncbi:hypothetical protein pdam_00012346 [Pocillopora damicornis]|uniref:Uncharacterized protein n=1 Tax=Pocillopora damicornis TaxID=46731 RepID=A0A3M6U2H3_POCDA|nr:hypothetical protein pdam_00012346 [Pocillopora damicornis]
MKNKKTTELAKASAGENDSDDETCEKESGVHQVHPAFLVLRKTPVTVCPGTRNAVRQGKDAAKLEHSGDAVL